MTLLRLACSKAGVGCTAAGSKDVVRDEAIVRGSTDTADALGMRGEAASRARLVTTLDIEWPLRLSTAGEHQQDDQITHCFLPPMVGLTA